MTVQFGDFLFSSRHISTGVFVIFTASMFKGLGTWLGLEKASDEKETLNVEHEEKVVEAQNEVNKQQPADQEREGAETKHANPEQRSGFGGEETTILSTPRHSLAFFLCLLCFVAITACFLGLSLSLLSLSGSF